MELPVKLTPFEWSMLEPVAGSFVSFSIQLFFSGELDSAAIRTAILRAQQMHLLLGANIQQIGRANEYQWIKAVQSEPFISIEPDEVDYSFEGEPFIDLTQEVGVRVWVRYSGATAEMKLQFHHACCDGIGALRFIEDMMCIYDQLVNGSADNKIRPLDPSELANRDPRSEQRLNFLDRIRRSFFVLPVRIVRMLTQPPVSIGMSIEPAQATSQFDCIPDRPKGVLDEATTKSLRKVAVAGKASINELLTRDLFLTLDGWNKEFGTRQQRPLKMLIPYSLRSSAHAKMPAANCVSMVFLTASEKALSDADELLTNISDQFEYVSCWKIQYSWNQTLALMASSKLVAWLLARNPNRQLATAVLTNISPVLGRAKLPRKGGKLLCGGLRLDSIHSAPTVNPAVQLTFFAHMYAKKLSLTVNYDETRLDPEIGNEIFRRLMVRVRSTAQAGDLKSD